MISAQVGDPLVAQVGRELGAHRACLGSSLSFERRGRAGRAKTLRAEALSEDTA
jgi:hypothetical protein